MRYFFTDGMNSFWHVVFGVVAVWFWWIIPLFVAYQLVDPFEKNVLVDLGEFAVGYSATSSFGASLMRRRF